ncbi:MAG: ribbon-helix-helix protein, CopG family [Deinococcus sp.]|nr:ribbon-helix-helix protein, CopG family [Deinococcus sp.]
MKKMVSPRRTAKVAISLPPEVLAAIEEQRRATGESRSQFFRRAAEALLKASAEQEKITRYIRGYQRLPESKQEREAWYQAALKALAAEPWE